MEYVTYLPWLALVVGILARMIGPYLIELYVASEAGDKIAWQWKYLRGQLILTAVVFLILPYIFPDLTMVGEMGVQQAWVQGFAVAAIGRELDKLIAVFGTKLGR